METYLKEIHTIVSLRVTKALENLLLSPLLPCVLSLDI